jgi:hypothetical protein
MMSPHLKSEQPERPIKPAISVRREDLGDSPQWFERRMGLSASQADTCARFCVRWSIGPPTLERLLKEVLP